MCNLFSFLVHYFFLCAFSWILTESVYMNTWNTSNGPKKKYWFGYFLLGWGESINNYNWSDTSIVMRVTLVKQSRFNDNKKRLILSLFLLRFTWNSNVFHVVYKYAWRLWELHVVSTVHYFVYIDVCLEPPNFFSCTICIDDDDEDETALGYMLCKHARIFLFLKYNFKSFVRLKVSRFWWRHTETRQ